MKEKHIIHTCRATNGQWHCYGTILGYDYTCSGTTQVQAKNKMLAQIAQLGIATCDIVWEKVKVNANTVEANYLSR